MDEGLGRARRVAFFGGSFDPPHEGHLAVARAAQMALGLDAVLFAPVGAQPLKPEGSVASFEDRVEMTRLAIAGEAGFALSLLDAPGLMAGPNYTVDSLLRLRDELALDARLFCLMGADSFLSLHRWHRAAEIPFLASLIVASRPGLPLEDIEGALPTGLWVSEESSAESAVLRSYFIGEPDGRTGSLFVLPGLHVEISASEIREAIHATDESFGLHTPLLCTAVLGYIRGHGLYR